MTSLVWSPEAQSDIFEILDHHSQIDPALADDIATRIERAPIPLIDYPRLGSRISMRSRIRKWRVPKTPFLLLYDHKDGEVGILRVLHLASNWRD